MSTGKHHEARNTIVGLIEQLPPGMRAFGALASLFIACVIVSQTFVEERWIRPDKVLSTTPGLISGGVAVVLTAPLVRADLMVLHRDKTWATVISLLVLLEIVYFTASLATITFGGNESWFGKPVGVFIVLIAILSNLNPSRYGELAIIALATISAINISEADNLMGFYGFLLWVFAGVGFLFAFDVARVSNLMFGRTPNNGGVSQV